MNQKPTGDIFPDSKVVDEFIEQFYNGEIKLRLEANAFMFSDNRGKLSLATLLSEAITNYVLAKSDLAQYQILVNKIKNDSTLNQIFLQVNKTANDYRAQCLRYLTYAKNADLIVETETMTSKLNKIQLENEQLKSENLILKRTNRELELENKRISKIFPDSKKGNTEVGDVE